MGLDLKNFLIRFSGPGPEDFVPANTKKEWAR